MSSGEPAVALRFCELVYRPEHCDTTGEGDGDGDRAGAPVSAVDAHDGARHRVVDSSFHAVAAEVRLAPPGHMVARRAADETALGVVEGSLAVLAFIAGDVRTVRSVDVYLREVGLLGKGERSYNNFEKKSATQSVSQNPLQVRQLMGPYGRQLSRSS